MYIKITLHVTDDFHFLQVQKKPQKQKHKTFPFEGSNMVHYS